MKDLMRSRIVKEAMMETGVSSVVSNTMVSDKPSTPKWYVELIAAYQI